MAKYGKVRRRVQEYVRSHHHHHHINHNTRNDLAVDCQFAVSPLATVDELTTTHSSAYVRRYLEGHMTPAEERNVGFPWSPAGVERTLSSVGGTVAAARNVVQAKMEMTTVTTTAPQKQQTKKDEGDDDRDKSFPSLPTTWAAHVAGGTHHAFYDYGEGFCVFSDIAVAANVVLNEFPSTVVKRILIVDLDVHQGNGNAVLFENNPKVVTFSMHCAGNYFSKKEASDLDIELPVGTRDETYLMTLQHWLSRIQKENNKAAGENNDNDSSFDLVFFQAGVDGLEDDRLGRMSLTARGLQRRNAMVYKFCHSQGLPLVITMGGGYPRQDWGPILGAHADVYTNAFDFLNEAAATYAASFDATTPAAARAL